MVTSSAIDKKLEIYKNLEIKLEICKNREMKLEIFEFFVSGRWTQYKAQNLLELRQKLGLS